MISVLKQAVQLSGPGATGSSAQFGSYGKWSDGPQLGVGRAGTLVRGPRSTGGRRRLLLLAVLLLPLLGRTSALAEPAHAQPELLALVRQHSTAHVRVIVQKTAPDVGVEALVTRLGGTVTKDLSIIHAFAADLPTSAVATLASAQGVRWISRDGPVVQSGGPDGTVNTTALVNAYNGALNVDKVWAQGYQGSSINVAVVDSGWSGHDDFRATPAGGNMRLVTRVGFNGNETNLDDHNAHATHVAGIIGGNGARANGQYIGIAPMVNLISVKVADQSGQGTDSGVVDGLQWIYNNRATYNIKVVNISLNSSAAQSYNNDPIDAAAEILWFNKIVVVASVGNNQTTTPGVVYAPANDPFVITVGAMDDKGTASITDDTLASFSAYGKTADGFAKPDVVAPGKNIIAPLASGGAELPSAHPDHLINNTSYFRMSGTSMSAPMVAGVAALILQKSPTLTPDQVKYRLMSTARKLSITGTGSGYVDAYASVNGTSTASANTKVVESKLLWQNGTAATWNSASWGSANWGSANWGSANWGSANWGSDYWGN